jgi:uncharacterized OB-fold protein
MMSLEVSICDSCGEVLAPPRLKCPECRKEMRMEEVSGLGEIATHTTVHIVPEGFQAPIMVGLVKMDAGGQVLARSDFELVTGMRVDVETHEDGTHRILKID